MGIYSHKGVHYHFSEWGDRDKPPLILLHGFAQSSATWDDVAPKLAADRYVVAPDFVGHGKTDCPDDPYAYELGPVLRSVAAMQHRLWADRVDLLGYSMGGRIALAYACTLPHRVASLTLESTGLGASTKQQHEAMLRRDLDLIERLRQSDIEGFVDFWEGQPLFDSQKQLPEDLRKRIRDARLANSTTALANTVRGTGQHTMPDFSRRIELLPFPVLYIAGILDRRYLKVAERLQHNRGISCVLLNTGHNAHIEDADGFARVVTKFLQESSPLSKVR